MILYEHIKCLCISKSNVCDSGDFLYLYFDGMTFHPSIFFYKIISDTTDSSNDNFRFKKNYITDKYAYFLVILDNLIVCHVYLHFLLSR